MSKVRILSIDGGGIRGIIPGVILSEIETRIQEQEKNKNARLADYVDLVAGTSTGGILACGLLIPNNGKGPSSKYTMQEVVDIYFDRGDEIFHIPFAHRVRTAGGIRDEKFPNDELKEALMDKFDEIWLSQLLKPCMITAYDTKRRETKFFTQHDASSSARDFLVRDVALATSAAPTYFEAARIKSKLQVPYPLIDGGVFANNPAMCAYAEARSMEFKGKFNLPTAKDMFLVSIGTGSIKKAYQYKDVKDFGMLEWIKPVIDIMMSANSETVHFQLRKMFNTVTGKGMENPDYVRMEPELLDASPEMDDASEMNMNNLREAALNYIAVNEALIDEVVRKLIAYK